MQLASSPAFPESPLAAMPQLSEKPRMGVRSKNPAWHPGFNVCNSTAVLGLQFRCSETVSGPVVAPNNAPQPTTLQKLEAAAKKFGCKGSAADRVWASVKQGAVIGAIRGGASGFVGGEIAEPIGGGIPGALLGGFLGGTMGGSGGVFTGSAIAIGCSLAGAY